VARVGAHGPDYQLGHAHADLLSFDLSHGAVRVVTDTGTGAYADGPLRRALRSTAAHNTIQLDGAELLEAWSSFRAGRRGRATALARGCDARFAWLAAAHDAYAWLDGAPRPHRLWIVAADEVCVVDVLRGRGRHRIASRLHLHPDAPAGSVDVIAVGGALRRETAPLHEHFGKTREMTRLVVEAETALPWAGCFRLGFGAPKPPPALELDDAVLRLRAADLEVDWRLDDASPAAVAIRARAG
jgi:hypothetical protein